MVNTEELELPTGPARRVLAALCHFSGVLPFYGAVFCAVIWLGNRKIDRPVAFHALQSLLAQLLFLAVLLIPLAGVAVVMWLATIYAPMAGAVMFANWWFVRLAFVVSWVVFIFATFQTYTSGRFMYPIIGSWAASSIQPDQEG